LVRERVGRAAAVVRPQQREQVVRRDRPVPQAAVHRPGVGPQVLLDIDRVVRLPHPGPALTGVRLQDERAPRTAGTSGQRLSHSRFECGYRSGLPARQLLL
jgi:hypothetical protein